MTFPHHRSSPFELEYPYLVIYIERFHLKKKKSPLAELASILWHTGRAIVAKYSFPVKDVTVFPTTTCHTLRS